jgi:hypothetical protein
MRRRRPGETVEELYSIRKKWKDYIRLRNRPRKRCVRCNKLFPNTEEYFATGAKNRMTSTCIECNHTGVRRLASQHTCEGICLICERHSPRLVRDMQVDPPTRVCRRCLQAVRMFCTTPRAAQRLAVYIQAGYGGKNSTSQTVMPDHNPPEVDDDEQVTDPAGEDAYDAAAYNQGAYDDDVEQVEGFFSTDREGT